MTINFDLLALRLRQYGLAWVIGFLAVMNGCLFAFGLLHIQMPAAVDLSLLASFTILAVLVVVAFVQALVSSESGATKTAIIAIGLFLLVPLLWAPVLGAISAAAIGHASIEYSTVYASFRILLGKGIYGVMRIFSQNPVIELGMKLMEIFAAVVGFIASISQVWEVMGKRKRVAGG